MFKTLAVAAVLVSFAHQAQAFSSCSRQVVIGYSQNHSAVRGLVNQMRREGWKCYNNIKMYETGPETFESEMSCTKWDNGDALVYGVTLYGECRNNKPYVYDVGYDGAG